MQAGNASPSGRRILLLALALALPRLVACAPAGEWREVLREDFDAGRLDPERWELIPDVSAAPSFDAHGGGKAVHIRRDAGNAGIATRLKVAPPYRLSFEFMQPAAEAGGYRLVVAQPRPEGNAWWFEFDRTGFAVWTTSDGGWAPRWQADGMRPDTWYRVDVEDQAERVRFRVMDADGKQIAGSDWLPHDMGTSASIAFRADSGGGLRGVLFDNISLSLPAGAPIGRVATSVDRALHEAMGVVAPGPHIATVSTRDGLAMTLDGSGSATHVRLGGRDVAPKAGGYGGFYAWDITQAPQYHRFTEAAPPSSDGTLNLRCESLGLSLSASFRASDDHIDLTGDLADLTGKDRAIILVFALPVDASGWTWGDDLNHSRHIEETGRYQNVFAYGVAGKRGTHLVSPYPWASVTSADRGLLIGRPMDWPRLNALWYDFTPERRFLGARVELGLSALTRKFPSHASFRFTLASVPQPRWGFRAATQRYYDLFPSLFTKRVQHEGIWHLWMTTKAPNPEDFGMVFHEQEPFSEDRVQFDNAHGGYSFTYSEPSTLWQRTSAYGADGHLQCKAFLAECLKRAADMGALTDYPFVQPKRLPDAELAKAALNSYVGREGEPTSFYNSPPDRVGLNCCSDPELPKPSRASLWFDYEGIPALTDRRVGGAYIDSVGWSSFDAAEDFRAQHWATAGLPLIPSFQTEAPAELAGFSHYELYAAIGDAMHSRGKLTLANTFPYCHGFYAHLFDVLGAGEAGDLQSFHDPDHLSFCRALSYHKPVSHMNYAYTKLSIPLADKERAIQRNLIYAVWPGTGNGGDVAQLEAIRPLYSKYVPILRALTQAGWEPITCAHVRPETVLVERYGKPGSDAVYLAVHNPGAEAVDARVTIEDGLPVAAGARDVVDIVTKERYRLQGRTVSVRLQAFQTMALAIPQPGH
jgi:hypothetical protein